MRLRRFEVRNFKSIEYARLEWHDVLVLIGENNCGKSSALAALSQFLSGGSIKDSSLFRGHRTDVDNAIELVGHFGELSAADLDQVAVRGRVTNNEWILKKRYWFEPAVGNDPDRGGWKEQLFSYSSEETFIGWPTPDTSWNAFPADYQPLIQQIPGPPARPSNSAREALRELVRVQRPDLVSMSPPAWVPNPGGGGNWKSNANSIIPRGIFVRAVHEASDETNSKDASTFGKLINLIVERQLSQRPEMAALEQALDGVLNLLRHDEANPEGQAEEVRQLQSRINQGLSDVIGAQALIRTATPELKTLLMPALSLLIKDPVAEIETEVGHQGHGLQRTLIMTLLQLLADVQSEPQGTGGNDFVRGTILLIEEPELYLHPQMERLMRDVLYRLASQPHMQVACCTHSPVFLDIADRYKSIVRLYRRADGNTLAHQVTADLFPAPRDAAEKEKLQTVARFHPTVNELFFAKQVVLFEEFSAIAAFERGAEVCGIFQRHQRVRRETSLVDCNGKTNIPAFQRILNAFNIPYRVLHDVDTNNPAAFAWNARITAALPAVGALQYAVGPNDLEGLLGYVASGGVSKPFAAVKKVDELFSQNALPAGFLEAMNVAYFGQTAEPVPVYVQAPILVPVQAQVPDPAPVPAPVPASAP